MELADWIGDDHYENADEEQMEKIEEDGDERPKEDFEMDEENQQQMEDEVEEDEPDFMDNSGQLWNFACRVENRKHLREWCQQMGGLEPGIEAELTRQFDCPDKNCQFKAIFLKTVGIVYSRNEHNHEVESVKINRENKEIENGGGDQEEAMPKCHSQGHYCLYGQIKNEEQLKKLIHEKRLFLAGGKEKTRLYYSCVLNRKKRRIGKEFGQKCKFRAIFDHKSCNLFITKIGHNHPSALTEPKKPLEIGDDYRDCLGKIWQFNREIGKDPPTRLFRSKFGFTNIKSKKSTMNMYCRRKGTDWACKFAGIFVKTNGCLYTRGWHQHGLGAGNEKKNGGIFGCKNANGFLKSKLKNDQQAKLQKKSTQNVGDDYMDPLGKLWKFKAEIGKEVRRKIFETEFGFGNIHLNKASLNLYCRKIGPNGRCKYVGVYLKGNGCLYTRGMHECRREKNEQKVAINPHDDYVDHGGKKWTFHSKVGKNISPEIFRTEFGFSKIQMRQPTINLYCLKKGPKGKCQFAGIYLKANGCLYIRGEHKHAEKKIAMKRTPNIGENYVDHLGKLWKFNTKIGKNVQRETFQTEFGFTGISKNQTTMNLYCKMNGPNGNRCKFAGVYLKENGCLYTRGKHEHEEEME